MNRELGQGPAYPVPTESGVETMINRGLKPEGMSKRFYAACAAMQGLLSNSNSVVRSYTSDQLALISFEHADKLLKKEND